MEFNGQQAPQETQPQTEGQPVEKKEEPKADFSKGFAALAMKEKKLPYKGLTKDIVVEAFPDLIPNEQATN